MVGVRLTLMTVRAYIHCRRFSKRCLRRAKRPKMRSEMPTIAPNAVSSKQLTAGGRRRLWEAKVMVEGGGLDWDLMGSRRSG